MREGTYSFGGRQGKGSWSLAGESLVLDTGGGAPLLLSLREVSGVAGDGYSLTLTSGGGVLELSRLGADGQTLLEQLWRTWPELRAAALRLSGSGTPERFVGRLDVGAAPKPCVILLYEDVLVAFPEVGDARPLFLALQSDLARDADGYGVVLQAGDGTSTRLSRLGGATEAFAQALADRRGRLAQEASAAVASGLPTLDAQARAALSGVWSPGGLRSLADLESRARGFSRAFRDSWLAACPRAAEGRHLLDGADQAEAFLTFSRPGAAPERGGEEDGPDAPPPEVGASGEAVAGAVASALPEGLAPPWLLVRRGGGWVLEALGETGRATYRFHGGEELPALCSRLLCAPQFSREALYQPLEKLVGEKADFAIPARELPFLRALRERFRGRVIHAGFEAWKAGLGKVSA